MPKLLENLERSIDRRFSLYREMSKRAGANTRSFRSEVDQSCVRAALLNCLSCRNTNACTAWLELDEPGVPLFCSARDAFLKLAEGTGSSEHHVRSRDWPRSDPRL